jgi:eukaryotic-like serine/threonine-protein kinase
MTNPGWPRVEELFHAALERVPAEREAFLAEACGGDQALRREVLSLLVEQPEAERLMERPAAADPTQRFAVTRGTRLGPYEVAELIGAGGMGEVYRARDTRLGRDVAVKVLPAAFASDPERLRRFEREAKAVASLSHPHIAPLFDVGEADGTHYLVMELLEGETLAARLARGPLPEKEALRVGAEIADALGAAHAHGVVHRDVKPGNVVLTRAGSKLLDFGVARLHGGAAAGGATAATTGLDAGAVAGTLPYMAPEQLEGRAADSRSDVWALGCVLFEMLTGTRAFEGDTPARLVAAIEKDEAPSVLAQRPGTSPGLDRLVRQCLQKDPDERWSSAHDLALRLREIAEAGPLDGPRSSPGRSRRARVLGAIGLIAFALGLGLIGGRLGRGTRPPAVGGPLVQSFVDLPAEAPPIRFVGALRSPSGPATRIALSPDGTLLGWAGLLDDTLAGSALFVLSLAGGEVRRLPGTEQAAQPVFSPDGRWIAFAAMSGSRRWLRKVPVGGGPVVTVAEIPRFLVGGLAWGPDGRIFLGGGFDLEGLLWVPDAGGELRELTRPDSTREAGHHLPSLTPDGRGLLFTTRPHAFGPFARVEVLALATGARHVLVEDCADGRYVPSGHLVCMRHGTLVAAPFDVERLRLAGPPVSVRERVLQSPNPAGGAASSGPGQFAVARTGLLAYVPGGVYEEPRVDLVLVDEAGRSERVAGFDRPLVASQGRFSPDGKRIAYVERAVSGRVWVFDVERGTHRALSRDGIAGCPRWSPDGSRLAVGWSREGPAGLWLVPLEGGAEWQRLAEGAWNWPGSWSPDGRVVAFVRVARRTGAAAANWDVLLYDLEGRGIVPFLATDATETQPEFSPDGRWLAYSSAESGRLEVYVTSYPDRRRTQVVSPDGGSQPAWSPDGRRLFFLSGARGTPGPPRALMQADVAPGPELRVGRVKRLFPLPDRTLEAAPLRDYDVHPDGRRFLFARLHESEPRPPITRLTLVHNWFAELEQLAPTGGPGVARGTQR